MVCRPFLGVLPAFDFFLSKFPFARLNNMVNSVGDWGCITYVMPGGVPFSSANCDYTPGTVTIDTTYAGGPTDQQIPMPLTAYLVVASSASLASSSAAEASSTSSSDSSNDNAASDWISHHKTLLIGAIAGAAVLLLICCCFGIFRKKRSRVKPIPAPAGRPPPQYYYVPEQEIPGQRQDQEQEHYPMMQYQYAPNK